MSDNTAAFINAVSEGFKTLTLVAAGATPTTAPAQSGTTLVNWLERNGKQWSDKINYVAEDGTVLGKDSDVSGHSTIVASVATDNG